MTKLKAILHLLAADHWSVSISAEPIRVKKTPHGHEVTVINAIIMYSNLPAERKPKPKKASRV